MLPKFNSTQTELETIREQFRQIHTIKDEIDKFNIPKWDTKFKEKLINDFTYHSNKIEGNSLSYGETLAFIKNATIPQNKPIGDIIDIQNHTNIMKNIMQHYDKLELSIDSIKIMHKNLMDNIVQWKFGEDYSPGQLKWDTNYTINAQGEVKEFMSVNTFKDVLEDVFKDVNQALQNTNETKLEGHPLYISTYFHQNFIYAHPFADGNGRIGRIMTNAILLKKNYTPIIITGDERSKYINLLDKGTISNNNKQNVSPELLIFFCEKEKQALSNKLETINKLHKGKNNTNSMNL